MLRTAVLLLLLVVATAASGCGLGSPSVQAGTAESLAAQGVMLAQGVVRGETTATFTRVHARDLARRAHVLAAKTSVAAIREVASQTAAQLETLADAPGDEDQALAAERRLRHLAERAAELP